MWTPDLVKIRFVEAAATERFLPMIRVGASNGYWPVFLHDQEDRAGWDDQARIDNAERWKGRAPLGAISRHQECLEWTSTHIHDDKRRKLVWAFAFCRANKWDFGKLCERKGWIKSTSYDRLNKLWDRLSQQFVATGVLLHLPSDYWIGHEEAEMPQILITSRNRNKDFPPVPKAVIYERSSDLIRTAEDAEIFAKHLARHNSASRREQERRYRREARLLEQIEAA
jgi:hypothetical protein